MNSQLKNLTITIKLSNLHDPFDECGGHEYDSGDFVFSKSETEELDTIIEKTGWKIVEYLIWKYQRDDANDGYTMEELENSPPEIKEKYGVR